MNRHRGYRDLLSTLSAAGIAVPPLGDISPSDIHAYGAWSWGGRYIPPFSLYMFDVDLVARHIVDQGALFTVAHAGHGINSYGLSLVTTAGPIAAYVQHGYGGAYSNPVRNLVDINATYSRLHVMLRAAQKLPAEEARWLIVSSHFRGARGLIDLDILRAGEPLQRATETFDSEPEIFKALTDRLGLNNLALGTAGGVSW